MKSYKEFKISFSPFLPDILSGLLWQLEIKGITEGDNCITVFSDDIEGVSVKNISDIADSLKAQKIIDEYSISEKILQEKNWNEEWEKSLNIIEVADKFVIKPSFRKYNDDSGKIVIQIDPKMSFGTGAHQTTKLVLSLLELYLTNGTKVLDVGSGTGILSIASAKLGAAKVIGIDNDPWCFENGMENTAVNQCSDLVEIRLGTIDRVAETGFDLILANINKNILLEAAKKLASKIKDTGTIILSGLLYSDENDILHAYKKFNLKKVHRKQLDEWIALVMQKSNQPG